MSLEAETRVLGVDFSTLAPQSAIQEVACVKLDARLGGVYFQDPPTSSMAHPGDKDKSYLSGEGRGQGTALGRNQTWLHNEGKKGPGGKSRMETLEAAQGKHELLALRTLRNNFLC